jgi:hypothetical protein
MNEKSGIMKFNEAQETVDRSTLDKLGSQSRPEHLSHTNNGHIDLSSVAHHAKIKLKGGRRHTSLM